MRSTLMWLVVGAIACFSPLTLASQTRVDAMGGGIKLLTVDDEVNIFDLPGLLLDYSNLALIDNIQGGDEATGPFPELRFGFHGRLSSRVVLAIYGGQVRSATRALGTGFNVAGNPFTGVHALSVGAQASQASGARDQRTGEQGPSGVPRPSLTEDAPFGSAADERLTDVDLKIALLLGVKIGTRVRLATMLTVLGDHGVRRQPIEGGQFEKSTLLVDWSVGLGVDWNRFKLDLSLALEAGGVHHAEDVLAVSDGVASKGDLVPHWKADHLGFRFVARGVYTVSDTVQVVPFTRLHLAAQDVMHQNREVPIPLGSWSGVDFLLGADVRVKLFDRVMLSPGIGIRFAQQTLKGAGITDRDMDQLMSLPFYGLAVDIRVLKWLNLRFGASQAVQFHRHSVTPPNASTTQDEAGSVTTRLGTGLGFRIPVKTSELTIDLHVDPLFWVNGPAFISGDASVGRWGLSGALRYAW